MKKQLLFFACLTLTIQVLKAQDTQIRGFANIDFATSEGNEAFFVGQYDNFITSQITDRISFIGEVVFEYDDGWLIDVERVIIKYEVDNYLNIKVGKIHTPIGYWNNAYHHGVLLQPTIARPLLVKFEDEGGILPIHNTGLWLSGRDMGSIGFGYDFAIGNGLGAGAISGEQDDNKSITLAAHIKPADFLEVGLSAYFDKLDAGAEALTGSLLVANMKNQMIVGHMAYLSPKFEAITEYHNISNDIGGNSTSTRAYFIYAGYNIDKITPYVRYDNIDYEDTEQYYVIDDKTMFTLGVKYNFDYLANVKVEYNNLDSQLSGTTDAVTVSFAVGF